MSTADIIQPKAFSTPNFPVKIGETTMFCHNLSAVINTTSTTPTHSIEASSEEQPAKRICNISSPGFRQVTCKARGLSKAHKAENAFIEIPDDAPHGLIVSCSHPECGGSGRKFRFCKVCALPVAKRNFLKRHGHGLVFTAQQLKENVDAVYCRVIPSTESATTEEPSSTAAAAVSVCDNEVNDSPSIGSEESVSDEIVKPCHARVVSFDASKKFHLPTVIEAHSASIVSDSSVGASDSSFTEFNTDERQWLTLFREKPCVEEQSLTHWMDNVLTIAAVPTTATRAPVANPLAPLQITAPPPHFIGYPQQQFEVPLDIAVDPLIIAEHIVPQSPQANPVISSAAATADGVPLVEPGMRISEENFAAAVQGIDFSTIFDCS